MILGLTIPSIKGLCEEIILGRYDLNINPSKPYDLTKPSKIVLPDIAPPLLSESLLIKHQNINSTPSIDYSVAGKIEPKSNFENKLRPDLDLVREEDEGGYYTVPSAPDRIYLPGGPDWI